MTRWTCPSCGRDYGYPLTACTWCRIPLDEVEPDIASVVAVTEVRGPSVGHEDVPYWCAFVRSEDGTRSIVELDHAVAVGATISVRAPAAAELAVVGILGTGTMGRSLVELLLQRGHKVVWCGRSEERLAGARDRVLERLARVMDEEQLVEVAERLATSATYGALAPCDVVIEAVVEELAPKREALASAESCLRRGAILTSNTSGLSIADLAAALKRPEDFGVLHFFNPATRMRLIEIAVGTETSKATAEFLGAFARSLGKIPVRVADRPAFAVNRALMPLLNEAVRELEEGVAPAESIDEAVRLGLNHPMGPLALADLIGLDVIVRIMDNLAERTGDEVYRPRPLLVSLVADGRLGRKTGDGFYHYER